MEANAAEARSPLSPIHANKFSPVPWAEGFVKSTAGKIGGRTIAKPLPIFNEQNLKPSRLSKASPAVTAFDPENIGAVSRTKLPRPATFGQGSRQAVSRIPRPPSSSTKVQNVAPRNLEPELASPSGYGKSYDNPEYDGTAPADFTPQVVRSVEAWLGTVAPLAQDSQPLSPAPLATPEAWAVLRHIYDQAPTSVPEGVRDLINSYLRTGPQMLSPEPSCENFANIPAPHTTAAAFIQPGAMGSHAPGIAAWLDSFLRTGAQVLSPEPGQPYCNVAAPAPRQHSANNAAVQDEDGGIHEKVDAVEEEDARGPLDASSVCSNSMSPVPAALQKSPLPPPPLVLPDEMDEATLGCYVSDGESLPTARDLVESHSSLPVISNKPASSFSFGMGGGGAVNKGDLADKEQEVASKPPHSAKQPQNFPFTAMMKHLRGSYDSPKIPHHQNDGGFEDLESPKSPSELTPLGMIGQQVQLGSGPVEVWIDHRGLRNALDTPTKHDLEILWGAMSGLDEAELKAAHLEKQRDDLHRELVTLTEQVAALGSEHASTLAAIELEKMAAKAEIARAQEAEASTRQLAEQVQSMYEICEAERATLSNRLHDVDSKALRHIEDLKEQLHQAQKELIRLEGGGDITSLAGIANVLRQVHYALGGLESESIEKKQAAADGGDVENDVGHCPAQSQLAASRAQLDLIEKVLIARTKSLEEENSMLRSAVEEARSFLLIESSREEEEEDKDDALAVMPSLEKETAMIVDYSHLVQSNSPGVDDVKVASPEGFLRDVSGAHLTVINVPLEEIVRVKEMVAYWEQLGSGNECRYDAAEDAAFPLFSLAGSADSSTPERVESEEEVLSTPGSQQRLGMALPRGVEKVPWAFNHSGHLPATPIAPACSPASLAISEKCMVASTPDSVPDAFSSPLPLSAFKRHSFAADAVRDRLHRLKSDLLAAQSKLQTVDDRLAAYVANSPSVSATPSSIAGYLGISRLALSTPSTTLIEAAGALQMLNSNDAHDDDDDWVNEEEECDFEGSGEEELVSEEESNSPHTTIDQCGGVNPSLGPSRNVDSILITRNQEALKDPGTSKPSVRFAQTVMVESSESAPLNDEQGSPPPPLTQHTSTFKLVRPPTPHSTVASNSLNAEQSVNKPGAGGRHHYTPTATRKLDMGAAYNNEYADSSSSSSSDEDEDGNGLDTSRMALLLGTPKMFAGLQTPRAHSSASSSSSFTPPKPVALLALRPMLGASRFRRSIVHPIVGHRKPSEIEEREFRRRAAALKIHVSPYFNKRREI